MIILATLFFLGGQPIELEEAITPEQKAWGLMGRDKLGDNEGMLFTFDPPQIICVWMFNCRVDLDVAFLDSDKVIREIHPLKAFPEKMDPRRPVLTLQDMRQYPPNDPIFQFFQSQSISSSFKATYMLEMPKSWFTKNNVKTGNSLKCNEAQCYQLKEITTTESRERK